MTDRANVRVITMKRSGRTHYVAESRLEWFFTYCGKRIPVGSVAVEDTAPGIPRASCLSCQRSTKRGG